MSLILRTNLSRPLTHEELDGNFTYLNIHPWSKQGYEQGQYVLYGISGVTSLYYCTLTHTDNPYTLNSNNFTTFYLDGTGTHEIWERIGGSGGSGSVTGGINTTGTTYTITGAVGNIFKGQTTGGTLQFKSLYSPDGSIIITHDGGSVYLSTIPAPSPTATYSHITTTGTTCYGGSNGSIKIVATGGTGNRKFSIDNGATWRPTVGFNAGTSQLYTGLPAGSYAILVADAILGTVVSATVTVGTPLKLGFYNNTAAHTNVTVSGMTNGTIAVQATGGTSPYQVKLDTGGSWIPYTGTTYTYTGLSANNYRIFIKDANACTPSVGDITIPITYSNLRMSLSSAAPIHPACHNGTGAVSATIINGSGSYQYALDGGSFGSTTTSTTIVFGGLAAGSGHYISIKDMANGQIINTSTLTINNPTAMTFQTTGVTNVSCGSGNTDIFVKVQNAVGTPQIQFPSVSGSWFNMSPTTPAGTYIFHTSGDTLTFRPYFNTPGIHTGILKIKDSICTTITGSTNYSVYYDSAVAFTSVFVSTPPSCPGDAWIYTLGFTGGSGTWDLSLNNFATYTTYTGSTAVLTIPMSTTGTTLTVRTVYLRDTNNHSCVTSVNLNNSRITGITATGVTRNPLCSGGRGYLKIMASGGRVDIGNTYVYALITGGLGGSVGTYGTSNTFTALTSGVYNVYVKSTISSPCSPASLVGGDFTITVPSDVYGAFYQLQNPSTCNGNDGYIRVDVSGGTGTYYVSKDGGSSFNGSSPLTPTTSDGHTFITIPSLVAGSYFVRVKDANGCVMTNQAAFPITLANPASPGYSVKTYTPPLCFGSNATIKLTATGGTPSYTFSSDGVTYTAPTSGSTKYYSVVPYTPSGSQRFYVKDSLNCVRFVDIFGSTNPAAMTAILTFDIGNHAVVNIVNGTSTKTVTLYDGLTVVDSVSGISTAYTSSGTYAGGTYHAVVTDSNGCTTTTNFLSPPTTATLYYFRYAIDAANSNYVENGSNFYNIGDPANIYTDVTTGLPATLDTVVNSFVGSLGTYGGGSINLTTSAPVGWGSGVISMSYGAVGYTNALAIIVPYTSPYTTLLSLLHLKDVSNMIPFNTTTPSAPITLDGQPYLVYNVFATSQSGSAVTTITIS